MNTLRTSAPPLPTLSLALFTALVTLCPAISLAVGGSANDPLYQWNFDTDTDTDIINTGALPGGTLALQGTTVHGSAGSGPTGAPADIALDSQLGVYNSSASSGSAASSAGDITTTTLNKITITGWLKDTAFSNYVSFGTPRILTLGPAGYDGALNTPGSLQLRVFNGFYNSNEYDGQLQLKINGAGGADDFSGVVSTVVHQDFTGLLPATSDWTFFAVTYNSDAGNQQPHPTVNMYIGDNVVEHTLTAPAFTADYPANSGATPSTPGPVQLTSALAYLLNSPDLSKAYVGLGDDFRLYGDVLSTADVNRVRLGLPFLTPGDWDLNGVQNAADVPAMLAAMTDLYKFRTDHNLSANDLLQIGDLNGDGSITHLDIQPELDQINSPLHKPGDWDLNGVDNVADIQAMLSALADLNKFQTDHGLLAGELLQIGDLNGDGSVTNLDIQLELELITASGTGSLAAVPEPSALALLVGGILVLGVCGFFGPQKFSGLFGGIENKVLASVVGAH